jgi:type II secretory pathway component PulF
MSIRFTSFAFAGLFLLLACVLGLFVVPKFGVIFAAMLLGDQIPWPTRVVMSVVQSAFVSLAIVGAALLVVTDSLRRARWLHVTLAIALACALALTVVALYLPLIWIIDQV